MRYFYTLPQSVLLHLNRLTFSHDQLNNVTYAHGKDIKFLTHTMEQSQAMCAILAEYRASDACAGPLQHGRLESAHHVEETTGEREHGLWLYSDIDTATWKAILISR